MRERLPIVLSVVALLTAVLGSTPIGNAAKNLVLPRASVGTAQLKNNAVTGAKVKNRSLLAVDFRRGQLPRGAQGPAGPTGQAGPQGPAGVSGLERVFTTGAINSNATKSLSAGCPSGKRAIAGGGTVLPENIANVAITASYPSGDSTWVTRAREVNATGSSWSLNAVVICAVASP